MGTILKTELLKKYYGTGENQVRALDGIDLSIEDGEFIAVVGTSGSGKSTLLHMLGGLDRPTSGKVYVDGKDIFSLKDDALCVFRRRKIGFVFQSYNLVPVLNVEENICLPIELDGGKADRSYIREIEEVLGIENKRKSLPGQLSGGQQQRVALARAMATGPKILLLDEPLSNLDAGLRVQLREELKELQKKLGITMVFVTHDQEEALSLSDKIVVMEKGVAVQTGTPREIYFSPVSRYVASFVGKANYIEENGRVQIVRPEDVWMEMDPSGDYTVRSASFMGAHTLYELENGSNVIKADLFGREGSLFSVGDRVRAGWGSRKDGPRDCHL